MSLINRVINQLEHRGAESDASLSQTRSVPTFSSPRKFLLPALLGVCAIAVLVWQGQKKAVRLPAAKPLAPIAQAGPVPVSAVIAASAVEEAAPTFQLSFELSSVAMPERSVGTEPPVPEKTAAARAKAAPAAAPAAPNDAVPVARKEAAKAVPSAKASAPVQPADNNVPPMKQVSPKQQAEAEFRKAVLLMQQGRIGDALAAYETALSLDAGHDQARQALALLLIENKRAADAERVLLEGIKNRPEKMGFAMMAARLQVERGAVDDGVATLENSLPFAGQQADYHAFLAALLQRQQRHKDAVDHYQIALQQAPNNGLWWMGMGISLQALQRNAEAKEAYKRALATQALRPDLQAYVQQKLKGL